MAISTFRVRKAAGWARTDVIYGLEEAFSLIGWHGDTLSGIVTGVVSYSGNTDTGDDDTDYEDCRPKSGGTNIGVGNTCSFTIDRNNGAVNQVVVNRPGAGYADGDNLVIDKDQTNDTNDMTIVVAVDETGYGSTSTFYDKDINSNTAPWGVLRTNIGGNKVYGDTYWGFQVNGNTLYFTSGTSFNPYNNSTSTGGFGNSFRGDINFELAQTPLDSDHRLQSSSVNNVIDIASASFASSSSRVLELNIFRSGIDPKFCVFSYKHPDLSSTEIGDNTFATFIIHNYTPTISNFDEMFLGSITFINGGPSSSDPYLVFTTYFGAQSNYSNGWYQGRMAFAGYQTGSTYSNTEYYKQDYYYATSYTHKLAADEPSIYYRNNTYAHSGNIQGMSNLSTKTPPDSVNHNAVIKGIPISGKLIPTPYYLPDDFVFIQIDIASNNQNIQQYDTVTISGSEVYTVIEGSYNQTTRTRGILFCARTVG